MKIVHQLGLAGLVETTRGRTGGLRLGKEPGAINIGDVVKLTEPDFRMVECFDAEVNECVLSPSCQLQGALAKATQAYLMVLSGFTLADMLKNSTSLRKRQIIQFHSREKDKAIA